jgi:hypothetical protein
LRLVDDDDGSRSTRLKEAFIGGVTQAKQKVREVLESFDPGDDGAERMMTDILGMLDKLEIRTRIGALELTSRIPREFAQMVLESVAKDLYHLLD